MNSDLNTMINMVYSVIKVYGIYGFASIFKAVFFRKDELEKKVVFDSLAYSMIIVLILAFIYPFISLLLKESINYVFISQYFISDGILFQDIFLSLVAVVAFSFNYLRLKYGLINKKQLVVPVAITTIIVFTVFITAIIK